MLKSLYTRSIWLVFATLLVILVGGKPADAGVCIVDGGVGTYTCSGAANPGTDATNGGLAAPLDPGVVVNMSTTAGFGLDNTSSSAFNLIGTGGASFVDSHNATISGQNRGIRVRNNTGGGVVITTTGSVTGGGDSGIHAQGFAGNTDITINAVNVSGATKGIEAVNNGSGTTSVTVSGVVTAGNTQGIQAHAVAGQMTNITLNSGANVSGGQGTAIANNESDSTVVINNGASFTGAISLGDGSDNVTFDGGDFSSVTSFNGGDDAATADGFSDTLTFRNAAGTVDANTITNFESVVVDNGSDITFTNTLSTGQLSATNSGAGALNVTSTGTVTGTEGDGINAVNDSSGTSLTVTAVNVSGAANGINADNNGSGATNITVSGTVSGTSGDGITVDSKSNKAVNITLNSGAAISGGSGNAIIDTNGNAVVAVNNGAAVNGAVSLGAGTDSMTVNSGGSVTGAINLNGGNDTLTFDGGDFSGVTSINGGGGNSDTLNFSNVAGALNGNIISNTERVNVNGGASLALSGTFDTQLTVNSGGAVTGVVNLGSSSNTLTFNGGDFSGVTSIDGGGGTDHIVFENTTGTLSGGTVSNVENLDIRNAASIALTGTHDRNITVRSGGSITSGVTQGSGANALTIESGGSVSGDISTGTGADNFSVNNGGSVTGNINTAGGADVVNIDGSVTGNLNVGGGTNTVDIDGGSLNGNIVAGTGNDTVTVRNSGGLTGSVDLGDGTDNLTFNNSQSLSNVTGIAAGSGNDTVTFRSVSGNIDASTVTGIETLNLENGANVSFSNTLHVSNFSATDSNISSTGQINVSSGGLIATNNTGSGLDISVGGVQSSAGITATNNGSGALSIAATGAVSVTSSGTGIFATNSSNGSNLVISTTSVSGQGNGIHATNSGTGNTSVTATGTVNGFGSFDDGVYVKGGSSSGNLTVSAASVSGGDYGIFADNNGSGSTSVTVSGTVSGSNEDGIHVDSKTGQAISITLNNGGSASGGSGNAIVDTLGDATVTLSSGASANGAISLGDGADGLTFDGGSFAAVTAMDGGNGSDVVTFRNTSGTVAGGVISNFEDVVIDNGANVSLNGTLDTDVAVNTGGTVSAGNSPGLLSIMGNLDLGVSSTTLFELAGLTPGVEIGGYDVIDVADDPGTTGTTEGVATIADGAIFDIDFFAGFMAGLGDTFDLLVADTINVVDFETWVFDFSDATLAANFGWNMSLHDLGNGRSSVRLEVVSSQVPEPGTLMVLIAGLMVIVVLRQSGRKLAKRT